MTKEKDGCCEDEKGMQNKKWHHHGHSGAGGGIYCLAFIGAAVYFIQRSDTFWMGVLGFLKALIWPAILMYKVLGLLKM